VISIPAFQFIADAGVLFLGGEKISLFTTTS